MVGIACEPSPTGRVDPPGPSDDEVTTAPDVVRHEIIRIDQDLHPDENYEIVIDGWVHGEELVDARIESRRILGVPVDLSGVTVTCTDEAGTLREGELVGE